MNQRHTGTQRRVLDPMDRIAEVLFGLIMVLTFTGSLSAATSGREEIRTMLIGAVGCNLAWGIVDAAMFLMAQLSERGRGLVAYRTARHAREPERARQAIVDALPPSSRRCCRRASSTRFASGSEASPSRRRRRA